MSVAVRVGLYVVTTIAWIGGVSGQTTAKGEDSRRVAVIAPVVDQTGALREPARLRLRLEDGSTATVALDPEIRRVAEAVDVGDVGLVVGQTDRAWVLQRADLTKARIIESLRCGDPQPAVSPDGKVVVFTGSYGPHGPTAYQNVVFLMSSASGVVTVGLPEDLLGAGPPSVGEVDRMWANSVRSNFLWQPDGKAVVFVTARGVQWWSLDLCRMDLSGGADKPAVSRRRLNFERLFDRGHGPSESCKYNVKSIAWTNRGQVRVEIGRCFFMNTTSIDVPAPDGASGVATATQAGLPRGLEWGNAAPSGFTERGRSRWLCEARVSDDGSVQSVLGEKIWFVSDVQRLDIDLRLAALGNPEEVVRAQAELRSGNLGVRWSQLPEGSAAPCGSGQCWSSTDQGLFRLLTQAGRFFVMVSAYGREVLPGEKADTDASTKRESAMAMADLVVRALSAQGHNY